MESLLETIDLDVDDSNELLFRVKVEGLKQAPSVMRLICEAESGISYAFNGKPVDDDVVQFILPSMKGKMGEGLYKSTVEIVVENRYFAPVSFQINFKQRIAVVAEAIKQPESKAKPIGVSVKPLSLKERYELKRKK